MTGCGVNDLIWHRTHDWVQQLPLKHNLLTCTKCGLRDIPIMTILGHIGSCVPTLALRNSGFPVWKEYSQFAEMRE